MRSRSRHGTVAAVRSVDLALRDGEVAVLMGRNGSGKSSLLWALHGSGPRSGGAVTVATADRRAGRPGRPSRPAPGAATSAWCPRAPPTCSTSTRCEPSATRPTTRPAPAPAPPAATLDRLAPGIPDEHHPRDLSEGQQLALVLAIQLAATPGALLLDEPTRGLDYPAKAALAELLRDLAADGTGARRGDPRRRVRRHRGRPGRRAGRGPGRRRRPGHRRPRATPPPSRPRSPRCSPRPGCCGSTRCSAAAQPRLGRCVADGRPDQRHRAAPALDRWRSSSSRVAGLLAFRWPLFATADSRLGQNADAPLVFALLLPLLMAVVLFEISEGGLDVKAVAMLGVLSAVGAALRPLGAGTAGLETVFFLLVLGGRVFGPGFGFVLGSTTLFASALITGGVGPWLPYQMLGAAWVGLGAGLLPRVPGPLGAAAARRLRRGRRAALRRGAQLLVLAVRQRARERPVLRGRCRTVGEPAPVRRLLTGHLAVVGPRAGAHQRRPHRRHRSRRPRRPCAGPPAAPPSTPR